MYFFPLVPIHGPGPARRAPRAGLGRLHRVRGVGPAALGRRRAHTGLQDRVPRRAGQGVEQRRLPGQGLQLPGLLLLLYLFTVRWTSRTSLDYLDHLNGSVVFNQIGSANLLEI